MPGILQSLGSQRVRYDWATELNWIRVVSYAYLRLLIVLPAILIPACASTSTSIYDYWENHSFQQTDLCQKSVDKADPCLLFNTLSRFVIVIHTVEGFGIVNKAEIDVFLELSCFFYHPADVGNLISGSSAFSKTSLTIWKFLVHVLLKPGLENFEHYFTSVWDECNCAVVWAIFGIAFLRDWNENWPFPVLWLLLSFPNLLAYWVQHFHSIIFQDLK